MTRTKYPTSFYLSPRTREQLNELAERTGMNKSELVSLYIDRAYREETMTAQRLWVVEFRPGSQNVVPAPDLFPDWGAEGIEVIVADQFTAVVRARYNELERVVARFPYQRIVGHPADGRWVGEGGEEVYLYNAELLNTEEELWEAMGLEPQDFGGSTWDEVDPDVVRSHVPTF